MPGFTFLEPLVPGGQGMGTFHAGLLPVLEVCQLANDACVAGVGRLLTTGDPKTGIVAYADSSFFKAIVTPSILGYASLPSASYRLTVRSGPAAGASALGSIDIAFDAPTGRVTLPTGEVMAEFGTPLTVRFFIAKGSLCSTRSSDTPSEPCLEVTVGPAGGTFVNEDSVAGAYFPQNALSSTVTLIIERYEPPSGPGSPPNEYSCLPTSYPQYGGCYVFRTEPAVAQFNLEVVVGICPDPAAIPLESQLELWKWDEQDPSTTMALPRRNVEFLACPGFEDVPAPSALGRRLSWATRVLRPLAQLFGPAPLSAGKVSPFAGGLNDFSRIGWVRPLSLQIASGNNQQGVMGQPLPASAVVRVVANGEKVAGQNLGVAGIPVQFAPAVGSGSANPVTALTDANGYAGTSWTLGLAGTNSMSVNGSNPLTTFPNRAGVWSAPPRSGPVTFTASARLPYRVHFLSPLSSGKLAATDVNVPNVPVTVRTCSVQTSQCWSAAPVANTAMYHFQWTAGASFPAGTYTFDVLQGTTVLGHFEGAVGKKGSKPPAGTDFTFELGSTVQIKFLLIAQ